MMLCAYLLFSLADTTTKWMTLLGVPALQLAFFRYGFQFVFSSVESSYRGIDATEITANFPLLLIRAAALVSSTVAVFYALKYLPLSMFSAIMFSAPIFICLTSWPLLGERVGFWRWLAIMIGFVGILIIVRPFDSDFHWSALLALYAAMGMALYSIMTRKLAYKVRPHVMQFTTGLLGVLALLPLALYVWEPLTLHLLLMMFGVGFASWFGHEILTRAHKLAEASVLMPYSYSFIIYMTLTGYLVYGEVPDVLTVVGAVVIVASGLIIWVRERRRPRTAI